MAEFSVNVEEVSDNQADRINCLIKEYTELKKMINKYKTSRYYWELHYSTLSINIWSGQIKYTKLQENETRLRTSIIESTKLTDFKEQELKNLIAKRGIYFSEQCDNFRIKSTKFTDNFLRAQKEYSVDILTKDIKQYCDEYEKTNKELLELKNKLTKLEIDCGFNCLSLAEENDEILKINAVLIDVRENNNIKLLKIKSAQDMLKGLKNEIKQKKMLTNFFNK
ncbi:uncharacterized protein LOC117611838 [Osmia lignaria lignaria]|uniref:uncharacterized protein LOC117611838 n=1 Tax=Osmia lignaria lignaria TaxID=1437193 RepID=UPI00402B8F67